MDIYCNLSIIFLLLSWQTACTIHRMLVSTSFHQENICDVYKHAYVTYLKYNRNKSCLAKLHIENKCAQGYTKLKKSQSISPDEMFENISYLF